MLYKYATEILTESAASTLTTPFPQQGDSGHSLYSVTSSEAVFRFFIFFGATLILEIYILVIEIYIFRGDLCAISDKTATLVPSEACLRIFYRGNTSDFGFKIKLNVYRILWS